MDEGRRRMDDSDTGGRGNDAARPPLEEVDVREDDERDISSDERRRRRWGTAGGSDAGGLRRPPSSFAGPGGGSTVTAGGGVSGGAASSSMLPPPGGPPGAVWKESPSGLTATASTASTCSVSTVGSSLHSSADGALGRRDDRTNRVLRRPHRRRQRRTARPNPESLLMRQIQILSTLTGSSLVFFLVFYLSLPAFVLLASFGGFASLLSYVSYRYALLRYNRTLTQGGFLQYLPESMQRALTSTTLHEWMTDPAVFLEYRHMLLYFIPGLSPEQVEGMVRNLPPRHRDRLLTPGYMAPVVPEGARRAILPEEGDVVRARGAVEAERDLPGRGRRGDGGGGEMVVRQRGLPGLEDEDEEDGDGGEATLQDAVDGIFGAFTSLIRGRTAAPSMPSIVEEIDNDFGGGGNNVARALPSDMDWEGDDDEAFVTDGEGAANAVTAARGFPQPSAPPLSRSPPPVIEATTSTSSRAAPPLSHEDRQLVQQREAQTEQDQEARLLGDAVTAMIDNYTTSATTFLRDVTERFTPAAIRVGLGTSFASGLGLLGMQIYARLVVPRRLGGGSGGTSSGQQAATATWGWYGTAATYGLIGTAASGAATASVAWAARWAVRSYVAAGRAALAPSPGASDANGASNKAKGKEDDNKAKLD